jgi:hypothetical protein
MEMVKGSRGREKIDFIGAPLLDGEGDGFFDPTPAVLDEDGGGVGARPRGVAV